MFNYVSFIFALHDKTLCEPVCCVSCNSCELTCKWRCHNMVILSSLLAILNCDQAALRMLLSVCPFVCLSVCHTFFTMFLSLYHHEIFRNTFISCQMTQDCVILTLLFHCNYSDKFVSFLQRFKIIFLLMGPLDHRTMILLGPRALVKCPIIDVYIHCKFRNVSPWCR